MFVEQKIAQFLLKQMTGQNRPIRTYTHDDQNVSEAKKRYPITFSSFQNCIFSLIVGINENKTLAMLKIQVNFSILFENKRNNIFNR